MTKMNQQKVRGVQFFFQVPLISQSGTNLTVNVCLSFWKGCGTNDRENGGLER